MATMMAQLEYLAKLKMLKALVDHIQKFLLELGAGFAYVGRQVHVEVGGDDFYIDLIFLSHQAS